MGVNIAPLVLFANFLNNEDVKMVWPLLVLLIFLLNYLEYILLA